MKTPRTPLLLALLLLVAGISACSFLNSFQTEGTLVLPGLQAPVTVHRDEDKIFAVLPGGICGRLFHPHTKDQIESFMNGEKVYWWFSDKAIKEQSKAVLILTGK
jgi:hypothetical protein